jgi:hypothetical protein
MSRALTDAAQTPIARCEVRFESLIDPFSEAQVCVANDCGGDPCFRAPVRFGGNVGYLFRFTDRTQMCRPVSTISMSALYEDGGDDVVSGGGVGQELIQEIRGTLVLPQVMM